MGGQQLVVVPSLSLIWFFVTPWTAALRFPCPSSSPGPCAKSGQLSQSCHPTIWSSVSLFSSCIQSFPASGSFPASQFFASGGQIIGASASASVLSMNIQAWFPLGIDSSAPSLLYGPTLTSVHDYWKNHSLDYKDLCWQSNVSAF